MTELEILIKIYNATPKKPTYTKEAELMQHVRAFIELLPNATFIRIDGVDERGKSDCIICYRGRLIAAELKDDIGSPTRQQILFVESIKQSGGIAGVCRNLLDVLHLLMLTHK